MRNTTLQRIHLRRLLSLCIVAVVFALLAISCKPDDVIKQIIPSTDTLVIREGNYSVLTLTNNTDQLCFWNIDDGPWWIGCGCEDDCILPKGTIDIVFWGNIYDDFTEPIIGDFHINTSFGSVPITVICYPNLETLYEIPHELHFPLGVDSQRLTIENIGNVQLDYSVTSFSPAISISQTSGEVAVGLHANIGVTVDRQAIRGDLETLYLNVTINGEINTVRLRVDME